MANHSHKMATALAMTSSFASPFLLYCSQAFTRRRAAPDADARALHTLFLSRRQASKQASRQPTTLPRVWGGQGRVSWANLN